MDADRFDLLEGERVLFESSPAVLTNQRLLVTRRGAEGKDGLEEVPLKEIASYQKTNRGHESRVKLGLRLGAVGAVLLALEFLVPDLPVVVETLMFLAGASGVLIGAYFWLGNLTQENPHTLVCFYLHSGQNVYVPFSGRDSAEAEEFTRRLARAKRGR